MNFLVGSQKEEKWAIMRIQKLTLCYFDFDIWIIFLLVALLTKLLQVDRLGLQYGPCHKIQSSLFHEKTKFNYQRGVRQMVHNLVCYKDEDKSLNLKKHYC